MNTPINSYKITNNIEIVNRSAVGFIYEYGQSVKMLHNRNLFGVNTLIIVVPNENFHYNIKLSGSSRKSEATLLKLYAYYCKKFNLPNIFA